jgi:hypothetical protein
MLGGIKKHKNMFLPMVGQFLQCLTSKGGSIVGAGGLSQWDIHT